MSLMEGWNVTSSGNEFSCNIRPFLTPLNPVNSRKKIKKKNESDGNLSFDSSSSTHEVPGVNLWTSPSSDRQKGRKENNEFIQRVSSDNDTSSNRLLDSSDFDSNLYQISNPEVRGKKKRKKNKFKRHTNFSSRSDYISPESNIVKQTEEDPGEAHYLPAYATYTFHDSYVQFIKGKQNNRTSVKNKVSGKPYQFALPDESPKFNQTAKMKGKKKVNSDNLMEVGDETNSPFKTDIERIIPFSQEGETNELLRSNVQKNTIFNKNGKEKKKAKHFHNFNTPWNVTHALELPVKEVNTSDMVFDQRPKKKRKRKSILDYSIEETSDTNTQVESDAGKTVSFLQEGESDELLGNHVEKCSSLYEERKKKNKEMHFDSLGKPWSVTHSVELPDKEINTIHMFNQRKKKKQKKEDFSDPCLEETHGTDLQPRIFMEDVMPVLDEGETDGFCRSNVEKRSLLKKKVKEKNKDKHFHNFENGWSVTHAVELSGQEMISSETNFNQISKKKREKKNNLDHSIEESNNANAQPITVVEEITPLSQEGEKDVFLGGNVGKHSGLNKKMKVKKEKYFDSIRGPEGQTCAVEFLDSEADASGAMFYQSIEKKRKKKKILNNCTEETNYSDTQPKTCIKEIIPVLQERENNALLESNEKENNKLSKKIRKDKENHFDSFRGLKSEICATEAPDLEVNISDTMFYQRTKKKKGKNKNSDNSLEETIYVDTQPRADVEEIIPISQEDENDVLLGSNIEEHNELNKKKKVIKEKYFDSSRAPEGETRAVDFMDSKADANDAMFNQRTEKKRKKKNILNNSMEESIDADTQPKTVVEEIVPIPHEENDELLESNVKKQKVINEKRKVKKRKYFDSLEEENEEESTVVSSGLEANTSDTKFIQKAKNKRKKKKNSDNSMEDTNDDETQSRTVVEEIVHIAQDKENDKLLESNVVNQNVIKERKKKGKKTNKRESDDIITTDTLNDDQIVSLSPINRKQSRVSTGTNLFTESSYGSLLANLDNTRFNEKFSKKECKTNNSKDSIEKQDRVEMNCGLSDDVKTSNWSQKRRKTDVEVSETNSTAENDRNKSLECYGRTGELTHNSELPAKEPVIVNDVNNSELSNSPRDVTCTSSPKNKKTLRTSLKNNIKPRRSAWKKASEECLNDNGSSSSQIGDNDGGADKGSENDVRANEVAYNNIITSLSEKNVLTGQDAYKNGQLQPSHSTPLKNKCLEPDVVTENTPNVEMTFDNETLDQNVFSSDDDSNSDTSKSTSELEEETQYDERLKEVLLQRQDIEQSDFKEICFKDLCIVLDHDIPTLHMAEIRPCCLPTKTEKIYLTSLGMKEGKFNASEDSILKANWENFSKLYDIAHPSFVMEMRRNRYPEAKKDFLQFLGKGLPHRALFQIYNRFNMLLYSKKGHYSQEEDKIILKVMKKGISQPYCILSQVLKRTRQSIYKRYQMLLALKSEKHVEVSERRRWNKPFAERVLKSLVKAIRVSSLDELKYRSIPFKEWRKVEKDIGVPNWKLRQFWNYKLHTQLFTKCSVSQKEIFQNLIEWLRKTNPHSEEEIKWENSTSVLPGSTPWFMWKSFRQIKKTYKIQQFKTLREFIGALYRKKDVFNNEKRYLTRYKVDKNYSLTLFKNDKNDNDKDD